MGQRIGSHGAGSWCVPGGHLEYLETPEECAARETLEETGLVIDNIKPLSFTNDFFERDGKTLHYITIYCIGRIVEGSPVLKEPHKCLGWEFFDWENLPAPLFLDYTKVTTKEDIAAYLSE